MIYVRYSGQHVAERVRPAEGSARARELAALAADEGSNWHEEAPGPAAEQGPEGGAEPEPVPAPAGEAEQLAAAEGPKPLPAVEEEQPKPAARGRRRGGA